MAGDILKTTKIELRSVLLSFPVGVTYKQLNSEYQMRIGRDIPVMQCGYDRLDKLLRDMPDVVRTDYDRNTGSTVLYGVADETTQHIDRMVACQKKSRKKFSDSSSKRYRSFVSQSTHGLSRGSNLSTSYRSSRPVVSVPVTHSQAIKPVPLVPVAQTQAIKPVIEKESRYQNNREMSRDEVKNDVHIPSRKLQATAETPSRSHVSTEMPKEVKKVLDHQIQKSFDQNYEKLAPHVEKFLASFRSDESVAIRDMVVELLVECPSGIWLKDFARAFEKKFGGSIENYWMDYGSVYELLISMRDSVDLLDMSNGDTLVKRKFGAAVVTGHRGPSTGFSSSGPVMGSRLHKTSETASSVRKEREVPLDAIGPGATIRRQPAPPVSDRYVLIQVSNVVNPGLFDLQLVGSDTSEALDELMMIMQSTYNHESGDDYTMPRSLMHIGQLCAARYHDEWHRCFITGFKDQAVNVCFFDYGTTGSANGPLRLLRQRYTGLPIQALRARLSNVQPIDRVWSTSACKYFMELINNRKLYAIVTHNDEDMISVTLIDTSGKDDLHINEAMVEKGYATYIPDIFDEPRRNVSADTSTVPRSQSPPCPSPNRPLAVEHGPATISVKPIDINACSVKPVKLTSEFSIHLINIEEKGYVVSAEVSLFMWKEDLVRAKLRELGVTNLPKLVLLLEEHAEVFRLLQLFSIPGVVKQGKLATVLVLYELQSVVDILNIFQHPSEELQAALRLQVTQFDPRDPCWCPKKPDSFSETDDVGFGKEKKLSFNVSDLEEKFERVKDKRNHLYKSLQQSQSSSESSRIVEEIKKLEEDMSYLKRLLSEYKTHVNTNVDDSSSKDYGTKLRVSVEKTPFESHDLPARPRRTPVGGTVSMDQHRKESPDMTYRSYMQSPCLETPAFTTAEQFSAPRSFTASPNTSNTHPLFSHPLFTNQDLGGLSGQSMQDPSAQLSRLLLGSSTVPSQAGQANFLGAESLLSGAALRNVFTPNQFAGNMAASYPFLAAGNFLPGSGLVGNLFGGLAGTQLPAAGVQGGLSLLQQANYLALLNAISSGQLPSSLGGSLLGLDVISRLSQDSATRRQ